MPTEIPRRRVAEELGFPFYVLNLEREFERDVVQPFVASYLNGETPIPCVSCNSRLKFASLDQLAASLGCDKVATGHYARVEYDRTADRFRLFRGRNLDKDQSYFLWELTQDQLSRAMFPLGEMSKPEVREVAREHALAVAEKSESQEICFVPDGNYAGFIDRYLDAETQSDRAPGAGASASSGGSPARDISASSPVITPKSSPSWSLSSRYRWTARRFRIGWSALPSPTSRTATSAASSTSARTTSSTRSRTPVTTPRRRALRWTGRHAGSAG